MITTSTSKSTKKKNKIFTKHRGDLIEIQRASYYRFLYRGIQKEVEILPNPVYDISATSSKFVWVPPYSLGAQSSPNLYLFNQTNKSLLYKFVEQHANLSQQLKWQARIKNIEKEIRSINLDFESFETKKKEESEIYLFFQYLSQIFSSLETKQNISVNRPEISQINDIDFKKNLERLENLRLDYYHYIRQPMDCLIQIQPNLNDLTSYQVNLLNILQKEKKIYDSNFEFDQFFGQNREFSVNFSYYDENLKGKKRLYNFWIENLNKKNFFKSFVSRNFKESFNLQLENKQINSEAVKKGFYDFFSLDSKQLETKKKLTFLNKFFTNTSDLEQLKNDIKDLLLIKFLSKRDIEKVKTKHTLKYDYKPLFLQPNSISFEAPKLNLSDCRRYRKSYLLSIFIGFIQLNSVENKKFLGTKLEQRTLDFLYLIPKIKRKNLIFPLEKKNLNFESYNFLPNKKLKKVCFNKFDGYINLIKVDKNKNKNIKQKISAISKTIEKKQLKGRIFLTQLPLMTQEGTFYINGIERVAVSQIVRSPGIYFEKNFVLPKGKKKYLDDDTKHQEYSCLIVSDFGHRTKITLKENFASIRDIKLPISPNYDAISLIDLAGVGPFSGMTINEFEDQLIYPEFLEFFGHDTIIKLLIDKRREFIKARNYVDNLGRYISCIQHALLKKKDKIKEFTIKLEEMKYEKEHYTLLRDTVAPRFQRAVQRMCRKREILYKEKEYSLTFPKTKIDEFVEGLEFGGSFLSPKSKEKTLLTTPESNERAILELPKSQDVFIKLDEFEPFSEVYDELVYYFDTDERFNIGEVGRYHVNKKFKIDLPKSATVLTLLDFSAIVNGLIGLKTGVTSADDVDHLKNKRIRSVGDLVQLYFKKSLRYLPYAKKGFYRKSLFQDSFDSQISNEKEIIPNEKTRNKIKFLASKFSKVNVLTFGKNFPNFEHSNIDNFDHDKKEFDMTEFRKEIYDNWKEIDNEKNEVDDEKDDFDKKIEKKYSYFDYPKIFIRVQRRKNKKKRPKLANLFNINQLNSEFSYEENNDYRNSDDEDLFIKTEKKTKTTVEKQLNDLEKILANRPEEKEKIIKKGENRKLIHLKKTLKKISNEMENKIKFWKSLKIQNRKKYLSLFKNIPSHLFINAHYKKAYFYLLNNLKDGNKYLEQSEYLIKNLISCQKVEEDIQILKNQIDKINRLKKRYSLKGLLEEILEKKIINQMDQEIQKLNYNVNNIQQFFSQNLSQDLIYGFDYSIGERIYKTVKEYFTLSPLSQYFDQTNPIAELAHKRKISVFGPDGLKRGYFKTKMRDIHPSQYGKICALETPDGENAGLVMALANLAKVNSMGRIETAYYRAENGYLLYKKNPIFLNSFNEVDNKVVFLNSSVNLKGKLIPKYISAKDNYIFSLSQAKDIKYYTFSPFQLISVGTSLVPFIEHDDANRALMGSNMQRQALPLLYPQKPIVGTGFEMSVPFECGLVTRNYSEGEILYSSSTIVIVKDIYNQIVFYPLKKYLRSNQEIAITQTPIYWKGEHVFSGQILADGPGTFEGELALGRNLSIGYLPYDGYNYEDAIVINENLVVNNILTSVHMEYYDIDFPFYENDDIDIYFDYEDFSYIQTKLNSSTNFENFHMMYKKQKLKNSTDLFFVNIEDFYKCFENSNNAKDLIEAINNLNKKESLVKSSYLIEYNDYYKIKKANIFQKFEEKKQKITYFRDSFRNFQEFLDFFRVLKPLKLFSDFFENSKALENNFSQFKTFQKIDYLAYLTNILKYEKNEDYFKETELEEFELTNVFEFKIVEITQKYNIEFFISEKSNFLKLDYNISSFKYYNKYTFEKLQKVIKTKGQKNKYQNKKKREKDFKNSLTEYVFSNYHLSKEFLTQDLFEGKDFFEDSSLRKIIELMINKSFESQLKKKIKRKYQTISRKQKKYKFFKKIFQKLFNSKFFEFLKKFPLEKREIIYNLIQIYWTKKLKQFSNFLVKKAFTNKEIFVKRDLKERSEIFRLEGLNKVDENSYCEIPENSWIFEDLEEDEELYTRDFLLQFNHLRGSLDENGIVKIGTYVKTDDLLVGKIKKNENRIQSPGERLQNAVYGKVRKPLKDISSTLETKTHGRVIDICIRNQTIEKRHVKEVESKSVLRISIAHFKKIEVGDKLSGRHGNKGVISRIVSNNDMPVLPDGSTLDILVNPLGVPSRMNVGQILECLLGFAGEHLSKRFKVSPFDEMYGNEASTILVHQKLKEARKKTSIDWLFNLNHPGKVFLRDGRTGEFFDNPTTIGRSYILKLVHVVDSKIHSRSKGPYTRDTQQPVKGRSRNGGQRLGEMEVWALEAHGCAWTLQELLTLKSDDMDGRKDFDDYIFKGRKKALTRSFSETFALLINELKSLGLNIDFVKQSSKVNDTITELELASLFSKPQEKTLEKDDELDETNINIFKLLERRLRAQAFIKDIEKYLVSDLEELKLSYYFQDNSPYEFFNKKKELENFLKIGT